MALRSRHAGGVPTTRANADGRTGAARGLKDKRTPSRASFIFAQSLLHTRISRAWLLAIGALALLVLAALRPRRTPWHITEDATGLRFHNGFVNVGKEPPAFMPGTPPKHPSEWVGPQHGLVLQRGDGWGEQIADAAVSDAEDVPAAWAGFAGRRIPRLIFTTERDYTFLSKPDRARWIQSCADRNPGWQVRVYSDDDAMAFVASEFPEFLDAYRALPASVQRADFFRYLILLRYGGAYVDSDVACKQPFDAVVQGADTLIVGWENVFPTVEIATQRTYARQKQILQWTLIAAPGHPALASISEHVARFARHIFTPNRDRNVLEVSGPGAWTDAVMRRLPPAVSPEDFARWRVKVLARVAWANFPAGLDGLPPQAPGEWVVHQFSGSWKSRRERHLVPRWGPRNPGPFLLRPLVSLVMARFKSWKDIPQSPPIWRAFVRRHFFRLSPYVKGNHLRPPAVSPLERPAHTRPLDDSLFLSIRDAWTGAFTDIRVHLVGVDAFVRGDGADPSADLLRWGAAFPPVAPVRGPLPHDALQGLLIESPVAKACAGRSGRDASAQWCWPVREGERWGRMHPGGRGAGMGGGAGGWGHASGVGWDPRSRRQGSSGGRGHESHDAGRARWSACGSQAAWGRSHGKEGSGAGSGVAVAAGASCSRSGERGPGSDSGHGVDGVSACTPARAGAGAVAIPARATRVDCQKRTVSGRPRVVLVDDAHAEVGVGAILGARRGLSVVAYRGDSSYAKLLAESAQGSREAMESAGGSVDLVEAQLGASEGVACAVRGDEWAATAAEAFRGGVRRLSVAETQGRPLTPEEGLEFRYPGQRYLPPAPPGLWDMGPSGECEAFVGDRVRLTSLDQEWRDGRLGLEDAEGWGLSVAGGGWEGWALWGARGVMASRAPRGVLLEWAPWEMVARGWGGDVQEFLPSIIARHRLGGRVYVAGSWCDHHLVDAGKYDRRRPLDTSALIWCRVATEAALRDLAKASALRHTRVHVLMVHEDTLTVSPAYARTWVTYMDAHALLVPSRDWWSRWVGPDPGPWDRVLLPDIVLPER